MIFEINNKANLDYKNKHILGYSVIKSITIVHLLCLSSARVLGTQKTQSLPWSSSQSSETDIQKIMKQNNTVKVEEETQQVPGGVRGGKGRMEASM